MTTRIEELATRLVHDAPVLDASTVRDLVTGLRDLGALGDHRAPLASVIATCVQLVADGQIDAGISLPHLAMACATIAPPDADARVLAAVQYEIETLLPVPGRAPSPAKLVEPDVLLTALRRR